MHLDWEVQDWEGQRFIYLENWTIGENHSVSNSRPKRPEQLITSLLFLSKLCMRSTQLHWN